ncbi:MAG: cobalamin-dependent protein, partial [Elusimicrobiales bacterium]|nr:cobalamin-dependent protein [Elusimicrobiales bacterium]
MKTVLLINPPYFEDIFGNSKVRSAVDRGIIVLGLASLAAPLRAAGHRVSILDLNMAADPDAALSAALDKKKPDYAGITFTTPLSAVAQRLASRIKAAVPSASVVFG